MKLKTGSSYDFTTYSPGILGKFTDYTVVASDTSHAVASQFDDVYATHANIVGQLPAGTPMEASSLTYVLVRKGNGPILPIALEWIIPESIRLRGSSKIVVTIRNTGEGGSDRIRRLLASDGFDIESIDLL